MSSTKRLWEIEMFLQIFNGRHLFYATALFIWRLSVFIARMNINGNKGHPWWRPLAIGKKYEGIPLIIIA